MPDSRFFVHHGEHAAQHIYRVAAGLDAVVKGEAEVLGQVREALALARVERHRGADPLAAVRVGHRDRRAACATRPPSAAPPCRSAASPPASPIRPLGCLDGATVLVIGAGQTAEIVVTSLVARGAGSVRVVNRTVDRAVDLAGRFGGTAVTMDRLRAASWPRPTSSSPPPTRRTIS